MDQKQKNEDIDLGIFLKKAKSLKRKSAMGYYKTSRFLLSNWIILLVLIVSGTAIGYFWEKLGEDTKESTLLVQINFNASSYVYNAVDLMANKLQDSDTAFFKEIGLYKNGENVLEEIEIKPVVNLMDILGKMEKDDPDIEPFIEQAQYEDNLLTSEIFIPEYKVHELKISTSERGGSETLQKVLDYLNGNELFQEMRKTVIENAQLKIKENIESIASIDSITTNYGRNPSGNGQGSQVFFYSPQNSDVHLLYEAKKELMEANESLQVELLKYDNVVVALSKSQLTIKESFDDKKTIIFPVVFVLIFLAGTFMVKSYHAGKALTEKNKLKA